MNIGILTLPLHTNYGGILQAYALQTVLERMGHEVVIFQKEKKTCFKLSLWKYPFSYGKRIFKKVFVDRRIPIFEEQKNKIEYTIIRQNTNRFIQNNIHTLVVDSLYNIDLKTFDAIVVGSDQIWRPRYVEYLWKTNVQDTFLNFTNDWKGKRIAYAASFGTDDWEYSGEETKECKKLIKQFHAVSVRESQGIELCVKYFGTNPELVLDPTLLLKAEDYCNLFKNNDVPPKYLFNYILDESEEKTELLNQISATKKLELRNIRIKSTDKYAPVAERIIPPVEAWLEGIYNADFVVTDSFHGCVFSIIFRKPFVAIANKRRGISRFISLFKELGLENHLILDNQDYNPNNLYKLPEDIDSRLGNLQSESLKFLYTSLNGN